LRFRAQPIGKTREDVCIRQVKNGEREQPEFSARLEPNPPRCAPARVMLCLLDHLAASTSAGGAGLLSRSSRSRCCLLSSRTPICALNVILAVSLDFVLGYAGQLNLGHAAFYGIGAYASTLLVMGLGVPFWAAFVLGAMLSGIAGMALAIFAARLRGHYLAIASLGFAVIVHQVLLNWISLTQGPLGIYAIKPPPAIALPGLPVVAFGDPANMFYLVAGFALLFYLLLDQLVRSPIGDTLAAIREDEVSAASFGIHCTAWKVFAFGLASALAGAAGGFYASFVGTLVPDAFTITESFTVLAMVIVGGMGTLIGPVWGALLLTVLPELFRGFGDFRLVLYGATLTLVVLFMPGGIAQAARILRRRVGSFLEPARVGFGQ
jgi:branched-chain amino acid transport system permease protein